MVFHFLLSACTLGIALGPSPASMLYICREARRDSDCWKIQSISAGQAKRNHACASKGLNGIELSLLHLGGLPSLDNGHALAIVDLVGPYVVAAQIPAALDLVGLATNFTLVGLHDFLYGCPNVTQPDIYASLFHTCKLTLCEDWRVAWAGIHTTNALLKHFGLFVGKGNIKDWQQGLGLLNISAVVRNNEAWIEKAIAPNFKCGGKCELPALVAACTASRSGSYFGLNAMVKALSTILPPMCVPKSARHMSMQKKPLHEMQR